MWKAGNSAEDCMRVTSRKTEAMFKRYADLFSEEEIRAQQRAKFSSAGVSGARCSLRM